MARCARTAAFSPFDFAQGRRRNPFVHPQLTGIHPRAYPKCARMIWCMQMLSARYGTGGDVASATSLPYGRELMQMPEPAPFRDDQVSIAVNRPAVR